MIRQTLNLGHMQYVMEMYDAYVDNIVHYDEFVMIRNYDIINGVFDDKDLYFIDKALWDDYVNGYARIIWPVAEKHGGGYSLNYRMYNDFLSERSIRNEMEVYHIYNKYRKPSKIRCNKIRIYPPTVKTRSDIIIDVNNFINNVHVHYFCQSYYNQTYNSKEEFTINNYKYSQYIEFYVPNVYDLFGNDKKRTHDVHYFKDKLHEIDFSNIIDKYDNEFINNNYNGTLINTRELYKFSTEDPEIEFIYKGNKKPNVEEDNSNNTELINIHNKLYAIHDINTNDVYIPLSIYSLSYKIDEYYINNEFEGFKKHYISNAKSIENNYITYPVNVILYPVDDMVDDTYVLDEFYDQATTTFMTDLRISLSAKLGFHNNVPSIVTYFKYPDIYKFENFKEAYKFYNNVTEECYENINIDTMEKVFYDIDRYTEITDEDKRYTIEYYKRNYPLMKLPHFSESDELLELYKKMKKEVIYKELEESMETTFDFLGFRILVSSDINFKNIVFDNNYKIDFKDLDDFAFALNDIFANWNEVHEGLYIAKVIFIDRFLGTQILSNTVLLTDDWIKFMMDTVDYRIAEFENIGNEITNKYEDPREFSYLQNQKHQLDNLNETFAYNNFRYDIINEAIDAELDINTYINTYVISYVDDKNIAYLDENTIYDDMNFYFLENIKCVVENKVEESDNIIIGKSNSPRLLYRPLFYKTNDLKNIRIRNNMIQNIGIDLSEYMTKVDTFKLLINGSEYTEIARNDLYVIFKVNGAGFSKSSGMYDIVNENDELISYGRWSLI